MYSNKAVILTLMEHSALELCITLIEHSFTIRIGSNQNSVFFEYKCVYLLMLHDIGDIIMTYHDIKIYIMI